MRTSRRAGLLAVVFSSGLLFGLASAANAETLGEAVAMAYETNPGLLRARSQLRNADEAYYRATRSLGPTLTADAAISGSGDNDLLNGFDGSSSESTTVGVTANQTIYSGGRLSASIKAAEVNLLSQRESLRQAESNLVQSVVDAYVGVRRAIRQLEIATAAVEVSTRLRDESQARFEVGLGTATDRAQARARLAGAIASRTSVETTLANARAQYAAVIGQFPGELAPEPDISALIPATFALVSDSAQRNSPNLRQAYLTEQSTAIQIRSARAAYRPTVTVGAGVSYVNREFLNGNFDTDSAGLTTSARVSIPLFTGFTTASSVRSAVESNKDANIGIEQQRRTLLQSLTQTWNQLQSTRAQIVSQQEAVEATIVASEGTREEVAQGLRVTLDLLNAEQELRQNQVNLTNSQFSLYTSSVQLLNTMGLLNARIFAPNLTPYDVTEHFKEVNNFSLPWEPLVLTIDQIGAAPIPVRAAGANEIVPTVEPLSGE